jgi:hypothetical protein
VVHLGSTSYVDHNTREASKAYRQEGPLEDDDQWWHPTYINYR